MPKLLSHEEVSRLLRLDGESGKLYWKVDGRYKRAGREAGGPNNIHGELRWVICIDKGRYLRSRLVFLLEHGRWPDPFVDHINGVALDDRPRNLREATAQQNAWNRRRVAYRDLPMGVKLIASGRYQAVIMRDGMTFTLGTFDTAEKAQRAYRAKRIELFGEFA